ASVWMKGEIFKTIGHRPPESESLERGTEILQEVSDPDATAPEETVYLQQLNVQLTVTFSCLTPREQEVLVLRYGLDGEGRGQTLEQIAQHIGVSNSRVRDLIEQSLRKIRRSGQNEALKAYWLERTA
ncbi:MAG: sigma-70 family RNA polymerase sigma factor, partial [Ktedonobacteraceae bacterium]